MQAFLLYLTVFISFSALEQLCLTCSNQLGDVNELSFKKVDTRSHPQKGEPSQTDVMRWIRKHRYDVIPTVQHQFAGGHKRSKFRPTETPCACRAEFRPLVLGSLYYPGVIPAAYCEPRSCSNTTQVCQQRFYKIRILRRRNAAKLEPVDIFMPESLRPEWLLEEMNVAVSCECTQVK